MTDLSAEPVRPIRALLRGLDALRMLNRRDGMTVTEMAQKIRLPRTTAYRILETLRAGGWAIRDGADDRYRPSLLVRSLSDGLSDESWIARVAKPEMEELGREVLWPMGFYVLAEGKMILRSATDWQSPVALVRYATGDRAPLSTLPIGPALLAHWEKPEREALANALVEQDIVRRSLLAEADATANRGYCVRADAVEGECAIAIPVREATGPIYGVLQMRWIRTAATVDRIVDQTLPKLKAVADVMAKAAGIEHALAVADGNRRTG
jgi:IclR family transcriptional regulator, mhp operon transcriptional activator